MRRDEVREAVDGLCDVRAVQGGEDEVSRFRGLKGGLGRDGIPDFADKNDVWACRMDRRKPSAKLGVSIPTSRWVKKLVRS